MKNNNWTNYLISHNDWLNDLSNNNKPKTK